MSVLRVYTERQKLDTSSSPLKSQSPKDNMTALDKVLKLFILPDKVKASDYRSYSYLRKITNEHSIKLMFGYGDKRNPIWSSPIEVKTLQEACKVMEILEEGLTSNKTANLDFLDEPEDVRNEVVTNQNEVVTNEDEEDNEDPFA